MTSSPKTSETPWEKPARSRKAKKRSAKERATAWLVSHPVLSTIMIAVIFLGCLVLLLWYLVFSGLSSSADFIYANF